jgi:hypothetical protein
MSGAKLFTLTISTSILWDSVPQDEKSKIKGHVDEIIEKHTMELTKKIQVCLGETPVLKRKVGK